MTSFRRSVVLLAAVLLFASAGVAGACPTSYLFLSVTADDGPSTLVDLQCSPPGGAHPQAELACEELLAAGGDLDQLAGDDHVVACTMEYRPVTASATGHWEGEPVRWQREFSNGCTLTTATGTVFDF